MNCVSYTSYLQSIVVRCYEQDIQTILLTDYFVYIPCIICTISLLTMNDISGNNCCQLLYKTTYKFSNSRCFPCFYKTVDSSIRSTLGVKGFQNNFTGQCQKGNKDFTNSSINCSNLKRNNSSFLTALSKKKTYFRFIS